jgi:hypothetical protein
MGDEPRTLATAHDRRVQALESSLQSGRIVTR